MTYPALLYTSYSYRRLKYLIGTGAAFVPFKWDNTHMTDLKIEDGKVYLYSTEWMEITDADLLLKVIQRMDDTGQQLMDLKEAG